MRKHVFEANKFHTVPTWYPAYLPFNKRTGFKKEKAEMMNSISTSEISNNISPQFSEVVFKGKLDHLPQGSYDSSNRGIIQMYDSY